LRKAWHLRRAGFPQAWQLASPRKYGLKIGLLDSGLALSHPLLRPCIGASLNLVEPGAPAWDEAGHGTAVAGLILRAAHPLRPELLPVKVLDGRLEGWVAAVVRGLHWCAEQGCDLVNLSFGAGSRDLRSLREAVEALERAGILLVAAAGNAGVVEVPGALPTVLAVGAIGPDDRPGLDSAHGPGLSLLAPGVSIPVDLPAGGRRLASGTSLAAPLVTAAAALLLASEPALSPALVRERLLESAEWLPDLTAGEQGAGLLRADFALSAEAGRHGAFKHEQALLDRRTAQAIVT
jgi:subtilisin family serine protease